MRACVVVLLLLLPSCEQATDLGLGRVGLFLSRLAKSEPDFVVAPGIKVWQGVANAPGRRRVEKWVTWTTAFWSRFIPPKKLKAALKDVRLVFLDVKKAKADGWYILGVSYLGWSLVVMQRTFLGRPDWDGIGDTAIHELSHYAIMPVFGWGSWHHKVFEMLGFDK